MAQKQQSDNANNLTRRKFMHDGTIAAAGVAAGLGIVGSQNAYAEASASKTRSYNPEMEYRPLGKTGLWVSAVCLGGHWKRVDTIVPEIFTGVGWLGTDLDNEAFKKNRYDVITRCIERGINYVDCCISQEILAIAEALKGRRDKMYFGFSWYEKEMRNPKCRTTKVLLETLENGMREAKLDYVDIWRITMDDHSGRHTEGEVDEMINALEKAKKQGKVRFTGLSSHDRPHIKWMIETYPDTVQVVCTPFTAKSKERPKDSLFDAVKKHNTGVFGIKPFSSNAVFKGDSSVDSPHAEEDDRVARMAIRYILATEAITAPIPGMINQHQVDNVAKAVKEHRQLDHAEAKELGEVMDKAWANLPADYQWLKDWEYV